MTIPKRYVVIAEEDWVEFRWNIALEVVSVINKENLDAGLRAVSILRNADALKTVEWRDEAGNRVQ